MSMDVIMLTKNSEVILDECLDSLYQSFPVKNLIIVDGLSTDQTLRILSKYPRVNIFSHRGTRAQAREYGIQQVSTEWFLYLDSDVILCKDWYRHIEPELKDGVGAVWGIIYEPIPNMRSKTILKHFNYVYRLAFKIRGGCHDMMVRTKLVRDIKIPDRLHAYEDQFIMDWIQRKGHEVCISDLAYCQHKRPLSDWHWRGLVKNSTAEFKGMVYTKKFKYFLLYPSFLLFAVLQFVGKYKVKR